MPTAILMPALSPTMEKGKLAKWLKAEGDAVKSGDILAEIETDKATMEVEAVEEGTMGKILVADGTDDVPVNQTIAVLLEEGEDASALEGFSASAPAAAPAAAADTPPPTPAHKGEGSAPAAPQAPSSPLVGAAPTAPAPAAANGARVFASPLARRIARQEGIDIALVKGSGPHGRIVKRDVEQAIKDGTARTGAPAAAQPVALPPGMADDAIVKMFEPGSFDVVPHDGMRKIIAQRLTQSKQTVPHFYLSMDCELDSLLAVRVKLNDAAPKDAEGKPAYKVSVNDFIIKAMAMALQTVPDANASWTDGGMLLHKHSDVGVAVAIPGGLLTPVIRKAESKGLAQISNEMKDFAKRARARKLMPEEYQGGSTAVSNLGMFGIKNFSAVINPPHATILAVGAGEKRPVVVGNGVEVRTLMSVTLSTDHRAVDGALGAELLGAFKQFIEEPALMLV
jgi:pyruvate dehydrogenase E2 component (dihydrolipoamide acetyltransferase)